MIHRLVHISFSFSGVPKVLDLEPTFSRLGDWVRFSQTGWLLWTDQTALDLLNILSEAIDRTDGVVITATRNAEDFSGQLPDWVWNWVKTKIPTAFTSIDDPAHFAPKKLPPPRKG